MSEDKKQYCYDYPMFGFTVDAVITAMINNMPSVLLIERGNEPYKGCWALPGGFVNIDELPEDAIRRELKEELNLILSDEFVPPMFALGNGVNRDPRGRTISIVYGINLDQPDAWDIKAGDDAKDSRWFPIIRLPNLAFDHELILCRVLNEMHMLYPKPSGTEGINAY